jgi:subtilisin-like proprotein convertase family protein
MMKRWFVSLAALSIFVMSCAEATTGQKPDVVQPDVSDISPPLTEMVKMVTVGNTDVERGHEAEPARPIPHPQAQIAAQVDPVVQTEPGTAQIASTLVNFEGMGLGLPGFTVQSAPPDTDGDIGPNHYVQIVNQGVTIFNRAGAKVLGPMNTNTFFNGFAGACANTNDGDGTVRYDRISDRWVIAQFSVAGGNGPFFQCIAVSTTSDPTGTYARYQFSYTAFNDYPKMGLWPDGYYFTFNMFPGNQFGGGKACAMDRAKMLTGVVATMQCFDTGTDWGGVLASDLDGATPPPAGSPNYLVALGTNELGFWKMHTDFATPANSTFTGPTTIAVAAFNPLCDGGTCVKQPGTQTLDSLADRLMNRFVYRNFGNHESLIVSHSVAAGTGGGVRWYELRTPGTTPAIFQQGTYAPDNSFRWMSSIAMDSAGDIALGFAVSSATINPSVHYTARLPGDAPGTMGQGEGTIIAGGGAQSGLSRYGDYSSLNIDPTDDCTFWYTSEYLSTSGSFNWNTRVGSFKLAGCGTVTNDFTITPNPTSQTVAAGSSTSYAINTTVLSGTAQSIALTVTGLPAGVTGTFSPATVTAGQSSTLTLAAAATAGAGTTQFAITGSGGGVVHVANASVTVTNTNQAPTVQITAPGNGATVSGTITVSASAADVDGTVASVRFDLPNGTSVTDTTAPFSATFNTTSVPDGAGTLFKATAIDNQGASSTTASVSVTVQNGGPTCINNTFTATGLPLSIPDNNATGITSSLPVVGNGTVASMTLSLHITHTFRGDLKVTLVSPGGTQFVVSNRAGGSADNLVITNQAVTAFTGEVAAGTWQLKVADLASIDTGTLDSWSLAITGNCNAGAHWSGSATPNLPTIDNGSACTTLTVTDSGDASAAKLNISGRHDFRSILRGTLAHNGVTKTAFPVGTFPRNAGTFSFANRVVAGFTGSATGDWTLCIIDTDAFGDTGVLNSWAVHD